MPSGLTVPTLGGCLSSMVIHQHLASESGGVQMSLPSKMLGYLAADYFPVGGDLTLRLFINDTLQLQANLDQ